VKEEMVAKIRVQSFHRPASTRYRASGLLMLAARSGSSWRTQSFPQNGLLNPTRGRCYDGTTGPLPIIPIQPTALIHTKPDGLSLSLVLPIHGKYMHVYAPGKHGLSIARTYHRARSWRTSRRIWSRPSEFKLTCTPRSYLASTPGLRMSFNLPYCTSRSWTSPIQKLPLPP